MNGISVGGKAKKYVDMSEDELAAAEARNSAQRQVLVAKMILDPQISYTPVVDGEEPSENDTEGYPVELLSERYMKTLHEAHRVVNIPEAGLKSLQQFLTSRQPRQSRDGRERRICGRVARRAVSIHLIVCARMRISTTAHL